MAIAVDATRAPAALHVTVKGPWPAVSELRRLWTALIERGELTADTRALIDIRAVDETPAPDEVSEIISAAAQHHHWPLHRAYLLKSPTHFGLVRQLKSMSPSTVTIDVFAFEMAALDWLLRNDR